MKEMKASLSKEKPQSLRLTAALAVCALILGGLVAFEWSHPSASGAGDDSGQEELKKLKGDLAAASADCEHLARELELARLRGEAGHAGLLASLHRAVADFTMKNPVQANSGEFSFWELGFDGQHARLLRRLKIDPSELDNLRALVFSQSRAWREAQRLAAEARLPTSTRETFLAQLKAQNMQAITGLLGAEKAAEFQHYQEDLAFNVYADKIAGRLQVAGYPLSDSQTAVVAKSLAEVNPGEKFTPAINSVVLGKAEELLSSEQLAVFREIVEENQSVRAMRQSYQQLTAKNK